MSEVRSGVLDADRYLADCFRLARNIWDDGYRPDLLIALWRGGAPPGIAIQEYFRWRGHDLPHTAIRAHANFAAGRTGTFDIQGLEDEFASLDPTRSLIIVDNLVATGGTITAVLEALRARALDGMPPAKVATVYLQPDQFKLRERPDYWLHAVDVRPVFPHELGSMEPEELRAIDPEQDPAVGGPLDAAGDRPS